MQALGNDFVVFETITQDIPVSADLIEKMADRHFGIGCDQVLVIGQSQNKNADFDYRIYNSDGSSARQCGNGARCVGLFIQQKKLSSKKNIVLSTFEHLTHVDIHDLENISVDIGVPQFDQEKMQQLHIGVLSIGNPHAIIEVKDVGASDVDTIGKTYNAHPLFPEGVNVSFCQIVSKNNVKLRVFERGSGETLACGSAACATMAYLRSLNLIDESVQIELPGGILRVSWAGGKHPIILTGSAHHVFTGVYQND